MLNDFLDALEENIWEEVPVSLDSFIKDILRHPPLSPIQFKIATSMSQVLKYETLVDLYGKERADEMWAVTKKDIALILGKGAGKNATTQIAFLYIVYQLLCMKSPQEYYGKPLDDNIDIVNMATSARQATNGFFNKMAAMVRRIPWFAGKVRERTNDLRFDKFVTIHSLHSEPEGAEALNILAACLDEVDSPEIDGAKMYEYLSATVSSRFPVLGKIAMLSFPRTKDGFIMTFYEKSILGKIETKKTHTYKLDNALPDGIEENEFTVSWIEEEPTGYKFDNVFAAKYPSYLVNPTRTLEDYKMEVYRDPTNALMRFFANPPDSADNAFFKNHTKLETIFSKENENGYRYGDVMTTPKPDTTYYIHVDLSQVADRTVVAMGHVDRWAQVEVGSYQTEPQPYIEIDLFRVWEPTKENPVDHGEVMEFIFDLTKRFPVGIVTFDQWQSFDKINKLGEAGIRAEKKSLGRPEYQEFAMVVSDLRLKGPYDERLLDELKNLVILPNGKVDHPRKNHNDISEAICGVIRNCTANEMESSDVEIITLEELRRRNLQEENRQMGQKTVRPEIPNDIAEWLGGISAL